MTQLPRRILRIAGKDGLSFLQGMVSNDVLRLAKGPGIVWAALLTPQGKYLADFLVVNTGEALLLDLPDAMADQTLQRLNLYRLRADVAFQPVPLQVWRGIGPAPEGALPDPRHPALGWRLYAAQGQDEAVDWDRIRVQWLIPESGIELVPNDTYILEAGFERLNGVDFRKGCYVGQEVTARMKHKTELRKGLARVSVSTPVPPGTAILTADGKDVGTLYTQSQGEGIAWLRFDRAEGTLVAGAAQVTLLA